MFSGVPGLRRSKLARLGCAPCKTNEDGMVRHEDMYTH